MCVWVYPNRDVSHAPSGFRVARVVIDQQKKTPEIGDERRHTVFYTVVLCVAVAG